MRYVGAGAQTLPHPAPSRNLAGSRGLRPPPPTRQLRAALRRARSPAHRGRRGTTCGRPPPSHLGMRGSAAPRPWAPPRRPRRRPGGRRTDGREARRAVADGAAGRAPAGQSRPGAPPPPSGGSFGSPRRGGRRAREPGAQGRRVRAAVRSGRDAVWRARAEQPRPRGSAAPHLAGSYASATPTRQPGARCRRAQPGKCAQAGRDAGGGAPPSSLGPRGLPVRAQAPSPFLAVVRLR